jgi:hypothetical protein
MPTYDPAPPEVPALVADLLSEHYPDLAQANVSVGCLQANAKVKKNGMKAGPALKHHGWPAAAIIAINPEKKRVEGLPDATITIDGDRWPTWDAQQQVALIDHELFHLTLARDKYGEVREDSLGRPKLKMRPHDWETSGFKAIAERHGEASFEVKEARWLKDRYGQLLWDFGDPDHEPRRRSKGRQRVKEVAEVPFLEPTDDTETIVRKVQVMEAQADASNDFDEFSQDQPEMEVDPEPAEVA